jgi:hypothetical protein
LGVLKRIGYIVIGKDTSQGVTKDRDILFCCKMLLRKQWVRRFLLTTWVSKVIGEHEQFFKAWGENRRNGIRAK